MKLLIQYIKPQLRKFITGMWMKMFAAIMVLLVPYVLAYILDSVVPLANLQLILFYGFIMIFISFLGWVFDVKANRIASDVARNATQSIRNDLFEKTIHLSCKNFDEYTVPSLESRLTSDTYNVHHMIGMMQRMGVRAPILLIGGIVITFIMEPYLSMIILATLPFIAVLVYSKAVKGVEFYTRTQKAQDKMISVVRENARGIRVIKALSKTEYENNRYEIANMDLAEKEKEASKRMAIINPLMTLFMNLGMVLVIVVGAYRVSSGLSETGKIIAFTNYFVLISNAMMTIGRIFNTASKGIASANRIQEVLDTPVTEVKMDDETVYNDYAIQFDHVSFSYLGKQNNLSDISFSVKKGETLGIIGATGSGKSTIIQLLLKFYDVNEGTIYINGRKIQSLSHEELCQLFGTVMQNDFIFNGTVRENMDFYRGLDDSELLQACDVAQAEFVAKLDEQLDTVLYTKGVNLSGGQRQRVYLSRAFAAKPEILLLDDSSSALDYATDARLRKAIEEQFADSTKVIVAQRISSIMHADTILVLDEGKILAQGTHEELLASCDIYRAISETQIGGALFD